LAGKKKQSAKKKGRQERLPGMKDAKLEALHNAALSYAEIRDQRQALTKQEVELKGSLLTLMHKHKKDHYEYNGVTIDLVAEQETVKVRVAKAKLDADEPEEVSESSEVEQEPDESELEEFDPEEAEEELAEVAEG
jgi:hypothetical protein